ncbi:hypothetical protein RB195_026553 [Necator americanus]|uniref:Aminopeptidase n=1 Tax=Necator americanus TaxID=51031 RepID=A0ABR1EXE4_NECAM
MLLNIVWNIAVSYNLKIKIYLPFYVDFPPEKNLTTDGEVTIDILVREPTNSIVLNQNGLAIISDRCELHSNGARLFIQKMIVEDDLEKVTWVLKEALRADQIVKLKVLFTGIVNSNLNGLYQNYDYYEDSDSPRIAAVTQFEPTHARKMVPCFDEPEYKAIWNVTVIHPRGTSAISNGLEMSETTEPDGKWKVSMFHPSPLMSSYLLAIVVAEYDFDEAYTERGTRIRMWSRPSKSPKVRKILVNRTTVFISLFEKYFGINDIAVKQDLVAVREFGTGAMENWGLITIREEFVLSDYIDLYSAMRLVAHELVHQWFGNLVTMKFWEDLWLNEGFATFFEKIVQWDLKVHDEDLQVSPADLLLDLYKALDADSSTTSRPLSSIIEIPMEIEESFDGLSYSKGCSIIAMVKSVIGKINFKKAVNHYLKKFSFKNAHRDDLWQAFDEAIDAVPGPYKSALNVQDFGNQWTMQMGFPHVTVKNFNSTAVVITQEKYRRNPSISELPKYLSPRYGYKWDVPIWYQKLGGQPQFAWLRRNEPLYINVDSTEKPIILNVLTNCYYRQNYDRDGWQKIKEQLEKNPEVFPEFWRYSLISDAFAAAFIDRLDYELLFDMLYYAKKEKSGLVLNSISEKLSDIARLFPGRQGDYVYDYTEKIMKGISIIHNSITDLIMVRNESKASKKTKLRHKSGHVRLGMEAESSLELKVATSLTETMCRIGEKNCTKTFRSLFEKEILNRCKKGEKASECVRIKRHLRRCTYCTGVRTLGAVALRKVEDLLKVEDDIEEKKALVDGMSCVRSIKKMKRMLLKRLEDTDGDVRDRQERITWAFHATYEEPLAKYFLFSFCVEHWELIYERLKTRLDYINQVISACFKTVHSTTQLMLAKTFRKTFPSANKFHIIRQQIEEAETRIQWLKKNSKKLIHYFTTKANITIKPGRNYDDYDEKEKEGDNGNDESKV